MPKGVSSPCGLVAVTMEPTVGPSWSAMSLPSTMGAMEAVIWEDGGLGSSGSSRGLVGRSADGRERSWRCRL